MEIRQKRLTLKQQAAYRHIFYYEITERLSFHVYNGKYILDIYNKKKKKKKKKRKDNKKKKNLIKTSNFIQPYLLVRKYRKFNVPREKRIEVTRPEYSIEGPATILSINVATTL